VGGEAAGSSNPSSASDGIVSPETVAKSVPAGSSAGARFSRSRHFVQKYEKTE